MSAWSETEKRLQEHVNGKKQETVWSSTGMVLLAYRTQMPPYTPSVMLRIHIQPDTCHVLFVKPRQPTIPPLPTHQQSYQPASSNSRRKDVRAKKIDPTSNNSTTTSNWNVKFDSLTDNSILNTCFEFQPPIGHRKDTEDLGRVMITLMEKATPEDDSFRLHEPEWRSTEVVEFLSLIMSASTEQLVMVSPQHILVGLLLLTI
jgi:hypothetical protein